MAEIIPGDDEFLALLRAAAEAVPEDGQSFIPDPDTVLSVMLGEASPDQLTRFEIALAKSSRFRRQVMQLHLQMQSQFEADPEALRDIAVPTEESLKDSSRSSSLSRLIHSKSGTRSWLHAILSWISGRRELIVAVPATAIITFVAVYLISNSMLQDRELRIAATTSSAGDAGSKPLTMLLAQSLVSNDGLLERQGTRGGLTAIRRNDTPDSAAIFSFSQLLQESNDPLQPFILKSNPKSNADTSWSSAIQILVEVSDSVPPGRLAISVPVPFKELPSAQLWALTLPSRTLYTLAVTGDTVTVVWPDTNDRTGCFAITWQQGGYFEASATQFRAKHGILTTGDE